MRTFWSTERTILGGFGVAMVVLFIVAGISVWLTISLLNDLDTVSEQVRVLDAIGNANADLVQLATAARIYALDRSEQHFADWENQLGDAQDSVDKLKKSTRNNPALYPSALDIEKLLKEKVALTSRDSTSAQLTTIWAIAPSGAGAMRPIVGELLDMGEAERQLLAQRNEAARSTARAARWAIGLASGLAVFLVCGAAMVILKDLKARLRAAEELERAKLAAEAASLAKSAFLANMSHELRTPLTAIMGYADLLMTTSNSQGPHAQPARREEYLVTLRRSGEHLLNLINDILDVSKIEAGRMTVENVDCRLVDVLAEVESMISPRAREKSILFTLEYRTVVPEKFRTDPTRFRQILMNLVGNAVKFTDRGSVRVVVGFDQAAAPAGHGSGNGSPPGAPPREGQLAIAVIDTGVGISEEEQRSLFQPFVQADVSTTRRFGGTGLGLSISRRLARMLGGDISMESRLGQGSTFRLRLPVAMVGAAMLQPEEAGRAVAKISRTLGAITRKLGIRVLLAEDGEENQEVIALHLQHAGCDVTCAANGQEAHRKAIDARAAGDPYDVILMDMQMPVMDGYTATSKLRAEGYQGVIIALTAHAMPEDRERCLRVGCDEYAAKPVDIPELLALMERLSGRMGGGGEAGATVSDRLMEDPALRILTRKFCAGTEKTVVELRGLAAAAAWKELAGAAHKLAGSAGAYGFHEITRCAKALEQAARNAPAQAAEALAAVDDACRQARDRMASEASAGS